MKFDLYEKAKEKIIVVAHRGMFAGNIPCNTLPAYNAALTEGADMIEIDVEMSAEGKLYIFHPGMERPFLGSAKKLPEMTNAEVEAQRYRNYDHTPTEYGLATFDDVMEEFKGRCFINVDKFWGHPEEIYRAIKKHGIEEQILVKSAIKEDVINVLKENYIAHYLVNVYHKNTLIKVCFQTVVLGKNLERQQGDQTDQS